MKGQLKWHNKKMPVMVTFLLQLQTLGITVLQKKYSNVEAFLWILGSLQILIFSSAED